jgi:4-hydroxybenzoate polyprenyltransferase
MFGAGAVLLRGAGCTVNDMWDRDFDRQVERTKSRPLASGALTQGQALGWLAIQLSAGLGILLQMPPTSQVIGAASLPFVGAYPLMKRVTGYPQAFLGLTINWGAIMGWAAVHDSLNWGVVGPLYASGFFWTLLYDTIYAHQDKKDDMKVGIKSTAVTFGERTKVWLSGFGIANVACLSVAGVMADCHLPFFAGVTAAAAHLIWQVGSVDLHDADDCMAKFKSNAWYGAAVGAGIVADRLLVA